MSRGLLTHILKHVREQGWVQDGSIVVDPFGGIGSTGILGAYEGYQVVGCELEQRFVDLAKQNIALHAHALRELRCPIPVILQGDSRKLCEVVEKADICISSPPFIQSEGGKNAGLAKPGSPCTKGRRAIPYGFANQSQVGETPGQLGAMKPGQVDAVISSPPYAETLKGDGTQRETASESRAKRNTPGGSLGQSQRTQGYGSDGNLGNLKPGNVDAIVSSPPYETDALGHSRGKAGLARDKIYGAGPDTQYGRTEGNLGNGSGDTFWQAASEIVQQCHKILRPGGHAIWVVKSFVRKGAIVDFPGDWRRLCESVGFKTVCEHHAMLVKETKTDGLFGEIVEKKERKSFFRRLAEAKGSPPIDYEVVICCEKKGRTNKARPKERD